MTSEGSGLDSVRPSVGVGQVKITTTTRGSSRERKEYKGMMDTSTRWPKTDDPTVQGCEGTLSERRDAGEALMSECSLDRSKMVYYG